jgi:hypothetical protein
MSETVIVARRFCGPPGMGNGGYVAGLAAKALGAPAVEATLLAPTPLETPVHVVREGDELAFAHDGRELVRARRGDPEPPDEPAPALSEARAASNRSPFAGEDHPAPGCFVCGPARADGDGLKILCGHRKGEAGAEGEVAAAWTPGEDLADADGRIASEFLWAALDCPSYFATPLAESRAMALLARMSARVITRPEPGETLAVVARPESSEGRKHASTSALYDADGRLIAHASCLWIALKEQGAG